MSTPTDDNRDLLTVIAHMHAKPGKEAELRRELEALIEPTSQEDGFVNYNLHAANDDEGQFYLYENWQSEAALDAHLAAPHLVRFAGLIPELLDDNGLTIARLHRIA